MKYISVKLASQNWSMLERAITKLCRENRIDGAIKEGKTWLIPENASKPIDARTKDYALKQKETFNQLEYCQDNPREKVESAFYHKYKKKAEDYAFTPYRVCPLGAHVDHNLGKVTGFAIDKGIHFAYGPKQNGVIEIASLQFPKRAQWHVSSTPSEKQNDWADHLRGATIALNLRFPLRVGLCGVLEGELPIGGLSSSAAVIITFIHALAKLNHIHLNDKELIELAKEAENHYVGVACGKLDQSCEVYCQKDALLYMDLLTDQYELIPLNKKMKPFEIAIFFSGLERSLAASQFNMRVDELRCAAYSLKALAGMPYGKLNETNCRDVPYEIYLKYKDQLPLPFQKRAEHWYSEVKRVELGAKAFQEGDIETFGQLVFESGASSIHNWETGSKELIRLYEIMRHTKGIYGGRFSGAGFKGCCMALINPDDEKEILKNVKKEYLASFPELKDKYSAHICHTADGVKIKKSL